MDTTQLRSRFDQLRGRQLTIESEIEQATARIRESKRELRRHEQAREIVKEVGLKTQNQLSFHIGDIASLALEAVFEEPYELKVEFVERRNKTECDIYFLRDGERVNPTDASGGGAMDVAAFALRVASWSMASPRSRNTLILDEPMRFLDKDRQYQASKMIKEISDRLGVQFIIITHETSLTEAADKVFQVQIKKGKSKVL